MTGVARVAVLFLVLTAHVGTFDTFFVGQAGPYRVQVTVRPPGVVPGVAQITVRVDGGVVDAVTTQAAQWNVGSRGSPAPDAAVRVPGDSALWSSQLWLMTRSSYAVNVAVSGSAGSGTVTVPVTNVATQRLPMPAALGWGLAGFGAFLVFGLVSLVGAASRESVLAPGEQATPRDRRRARLAMAVTIPVLALVLTGGRAWWGSVDAGYANGLYRPMASEVGVRDPAGARVLRLTIVDPVYLRKQVTPIVPDHGKLMHLFLVGEGAGDARPLAHLHPAPVDSATFEAGTGALPAGRYRWFADIVQESGFAQTMTGTVSLGAPGAGAAFTDPDDAAYTGPAEGGERQNLADGLTVTRDSGDTLRAGTDVLLRFTVRDSAGAVATLERYMGMPAHAMVARDDFSVFAHLHGNGSFAMASLEMLQAVERGDTLPAVRPGTPRPRVDSSAAASHAMHLTADGRLEFPFAFPKPGSYTVWVQFRRAGTVHTAAFSLVVV